MIVLTYYANIMDKNSSDISFSIFPGFFFHDYIVDVYNMRTYTWHRNHGLVA